LHSSCEFEFLDEFIDNLDIPGRGGGDCKGFFLVIWECPVEIPFEVFEVGVLIFEFEEDLGLCLGWQVRGG
jgi:hypothetical protein